MSLDQLYQSKILEHNRAPHNHFEMSDASHSAHGLDALCGDDIRVWLRVRNGRIEAASWSGEACAITTASASMLTKWLIGRGTEEIEPAFRLFQELLEEGQQLDAPALGEISALLAVGRFPSRRRNALLPWNATVDALKLRAG
jgi:nitrogen fixation NifU-like protein